MHNYVVQGLQGLVAVVGPNLKHCAMDVGYGGRYGLSDALAKSLARKGSFTAAVDPRRWAAGVVHFWAIWGEAAEKEGRAPHHKKKARMRDWHGWYYETTGDVNRNKVGSGPVVLDDAHAAALPEISQATLQQHTTRDSCWVVVDGLVLDVTEWLERHPGGESVLLKRGGLDVSGPFRELQHSAHAVAVLKTCLVGRYRPDSKL
jgi:cytochrome b involved in lipid metabolism